MNRFTGFKNVVTDFNTDSEEVLTTALSNAMTFGLKVVCHILTISIAGPLKLFF